MFRVKRVGFNFLKSTLFLLKRRVFSSSVFSINNIKKKSKKKDEIKK